MIKSRALRIVLIISAVVAAIAAPLLIAPETGLRWGLLKALSRLGFNAVQLRDVRFAPFSGQIGLDDFDTGERPKGWAGLGRLDLSFTWSALFRRVIDIPEISAADAVLTLERGKAGWRILGLPNLPGPAGPETAEDSWLVNIHRLNLTNTQIHIVDGPNRLRIDAALAVIENVNTAQPDSPARFTVTGTLDGAPVSLSGDALLFAPAVQLRLKVKAGTLDPAAIFALAGLDVAAGGLDLQADIQFDASDSVRTRVVGNATLSRLELPFDGGHVHAAQARWSGNAEYSDDAGLGLSGKLALDRPVMRDSLAAIDAAGLNADIKQARLDSAFNTLTWDGGLQAKGWKMVMSDLSAAHESLIWNGKTRLDLSAKAETLFQAEGELRAAKTVLTGAGGRLNAGALTLRGTFNHARTGGVLPPLTGETALSAESAQISGGGFDWLTAKTLRIDRLHLTPEGVKADSVQATEAAALARPGAYGPRLRAASAELTDLRMAADGDVTVGNLSAADPVLRVNRNHAGIQGLYDLPRSSSSGGPGFKIGSIRLNGDGRLEFRDRAPSALVRLSMTGIDFSLGKLDSARPDADTPYSLSGALGDGVVYSTGTLRPLRGLDAADVNLELRSIELPALSPYAVDAAGVEILTGRLDAGLDVDIRAGKLDGLLETTIDSLKIARPDPSVPVVKTADMPVETVVDLLRDSDGRIQLSLPVRGDLTSPDFGTDAAIGKVIGNALKSTLFTTVKVAFPLLPLIGLVIDEIDNPRLALPPVTFPPGSDELQYQQERAAGLVAKMLREREAVRLNLCPVSVKAVDGPILRNQASLVARLKALMEEKDREELEEFERERLMRLAEKRAETLKSLLTETHGIDPQRLFSCRARIDADPKAEPRVDLVF